MVQADLVMIAGAIDVEEMIEIVGNLYELEGVSKVSFANSQTIKGQLLKERYGQYQTAQAGQFIFDQTQQTRLLDIS